MIVIASECHLLVHEEKNVNRHPISIQAHPIGPHHKINLLAVTGDQKVERPRKNDKVRLVTIGEGVRLFLLSLPSLTSSQMKHHGIVEMVSFSK